MTSKFFILSLALIACSLAFEISHKTDLNIDNLSDDQRKGRDQVQRQVSKLTGATLVGGQQNGNTYTFRFIGAELPRTLTDVTAVKNGDSWEVTKAATSSTVGGLDQGSRVTTRRTFTKGGNDFGAALRGAGL